VTTIRWAPQAAGDSGLSALRAARVSANSREYRTARSVPSIGYVIPELAMPDVGEPIITQYRVVYRVRGDTVEIATIFHAARLLPLKM